MRKNKKGDVNDIGIWISIVFVLGITFYIGSTVWINVVTPISDMAKNITTDPETDTKIDNSMTFITNTFNMLDWGFVIFFFGFYLALLISVFFIDTHPAFFVFALATLIIIFVVAGVLADTWMNFKGEIDTSLTSAGKLSPSATYPMMNEILSHLPIYVIVMSSIFLIVLYASKRNG